MTSSIQLVLSGVLTSSIQLVLNGVLNSGLSPGVGGNLVAIQASRIAAYLHPCSAPGTLPPDMASNRPDPCTNFCSEGASAIATGHTVCPES